LSTCFNFGFLSEAGERVVVVVVVVVAAAAVVVHFY